MKKNYLYLFAILLSVNAFSVVHANEVRNGDFSNATRFWFVLVNGGFRDDATLAPFINTDDDGLLLRVQQMDGEKDKPASVTLNQRVRELQNGVAYVLHFEVKGLPNESMLVGIGNPVSSGPDRGNLSGGIPVRKIEMKSHWEKVSIPFVYNRDETLTLPRDAQETLLQFRVGTLSTLQLRAVSVTEK